MNYEQFKKTTLLSDPPADLSVYLRALWFDAKGDWEKAHTIIQETEDTRAAWVHAYLHRKEGDTGNADYWYRRAGKIKPSVSLQEEWAGLVQALL